MPIQRYYCQVSDTVFFGARDGRFAMWLYYWCATIIFLGMAYASFSGASANRMDSPSHLGKLLGILFACTVAGVLVTPWALRYTVKKNANKNDFLLNMLLSLNFCIIFTANLRADAQSRVVIPYTYISYAVSAIAIVLISMFAMSLVTNAFDSCAQNPPIASNDTSDQQKDGQ